jgi:L-ascorbate metabolism protein UlaG (beta-lactamase superfamily)
MQITWFGHSAFRLDFGGNSVLIDPFFTGNPAFKGDPVEAGSGATHILLTHGHNDHTGDAPAIAARTGAKVVSTFEVCMWIKDKGAANIDPMNTGGSTDQGDFTVTMVQAFHSSADFDGKTLTYLGNPHGIIVEPKDGPTVYHMGDTAIFGDMALINELYQPKIGIVPIGGRFTMGPRIAAYACEKFFDFDVIIPCHYGSFPPLEPTAERFLSFMDNDRATRVIVPEVGVPFEVEA